MTSEEKEKFIRQKAEAHRPDTSEKIMWSAHALGKLRHERLRRDAVEGALKNSIIIEDYAMEGRPLPGALMLGFVEGRPIHVVLAVDAALERMFVITVYRPLEARWEDEWKRRKNRAQ
jgi:hypothetical protein